MAEKILFKEIPFVDVIREIVNSFAEKNDLHLVEANDEDQFADLHWFRGWELRKKDPSLGMTCIFLSPVYANGAIVMDVWALDKRRLALSYRYKYCPLYKEVGFFEGIKKFFDLRRRSYDVELRDEIGIKRNLKEALDLAYARNWL